MGTVSNILITISVIIICVVLFGLLVPIPRYSTETYTKQEPYTGKETYQEQVPMTVEECKYDISVNPTDYIKWGAEALLTGDNSKMFKACEDVTRYRTETRTRDITKYRTVTKQKEVVKKETLFVMIQRRYINR